MSIVPVSFLEFLKGETHPIIVRDTGILLRGHGTVSVEGGMVKVDIACPTISFDKGASWAMHNSAYHAEIVVDMANVSTLEYPGVCSIYMPYVSADCRIHDHSVDVNSLTM